MWCRVVALGLVVLLAGCAGLAGDTDDIPSRTRAPDVGLSRDESADLLTVFSVDTGVLWQEFTVDGSGFRHGLDGATRSPGETPGSGEARAGDTLVFCGTTDMRDVQVRLVHRSTNTQVYETTFATLAAC